MASLRHCARSLLSSLGVAADSGHESDMWLQERILGLSSGVSKGAHLPRELQLAAASHPLPVLNDIVLAFEVFRHNASSERLLRLMYYNEPEQAGSMGSAPSSGWKQLRLPCIARDACSNSEIIASAQTSALSNASAW